MENSQLIELLSSLNDQEKERVLEFASIPFFNSGRMKAQVKPLLELCFDRIKSKPSAGLDKLELYSSIFPDQPFVAGKLEKVMVDAHKVVKSFLLTQYYFREENNFYQTLDFAEIVRRKGLMDRYSSNMAKMQNMLDESPYNTVQLFQQRMMFENSVHYTESLNNQSKGDINLANTISALETYYYTRLVALTNRYLLQQYVTPLGAPDFIRPHLERLEIPDTYLQKNCVIKIYYCIYTLFKTAIFENVEIQNLIGLINQHEKELDQEVVQEFFSYARNFSIMALAKNLDRIDIRQTLHELYIDNIQRGYLHYEGKFSPSRFSSIADNAIRLNNLDWAIQFIETNKNLIYGENETHDIYRFVKAQYLFFIGQYQECLDILPQTSPFVIFLLLGKRIELKALYEIQSELFSYKLDAFKMFLSRTSSKILSEAQKRANSDFANFLTQIVSSTPGDDKRAEVILQRLEKNKQALDWVWLASKAQALHSKSKRP